ncbi:MAG: DUF4252 domain-containing protein [Xanthomonadales bacterium]|nr:DUF4252 domain-containing protein [Xanthomonadales bacterium]
MTSKSAIARAGAALLLALALAGCGLTAPRSSDGFADLDSLGISDTDRVLSISVGPALLRFAARHVEDKPETQALLRSLDGVRVRIYEIDGDAGRVAARMEGMSARLKDDGWEPVMTLRDEREQVHMLLRMTGERISGMTVLVSDGESEAVIVNLMGDIQPEQFSDVMVALDVDAAGVGDVRPDEEGQES